jgi:hypothetical protein
VSQFLKQRDINSYYSFRKKLNFFNVLGGRPQPAVLPGSGDSVQALRAARAHILLIPPPRPSALHTVLQGLHEGIHNVSLKTNARSARARSSANNQYAIIGSYMNKHCLFGFPSTTYYMRIRI